MAKQTMKCHRKMSVDRIRFWWLGGCLVFEMGINISLKDSSIFFCVMVSFI